MPTTSKLNAISLLAEATKMGQHWHHEILALIVLFFTKLTTSRNFQFFPFPPKSASCVHLSHRRQLYFGYDWLLIYQLDQQSTITNFEDFFEYKIPYFLCALTRTIQTVLHNRCEEANRTSGRASPWGDSRYRVPGWVSVGPQGRSHRGKRYPLEDNCNPEANSNK